MSDFHGRIMNIQINRATIEHSPAQDKRLYKLGHRDARHAAAEIALEADRQLAAAEQMADALRAAIERMRGLGERDHDHDPCGCGYCVAVQGLAAWEAAKK